MSHSHQVRDWTFNYNSDLSGMVDISGPKIGRVQVDGEALLSFVAAWVRDQKVSAVESMQAHELFGISKARMPYMSEVLP